MIQFSPQFLANLQGDVQGVKNFATNVGQGVENLAGKAVNALRTQGQNYTKFVSPVQGPSWSQLFQHPISAIENIHTNPTSVFNQNNTIAPADRGTANAALRDSMLNVAGLTGGIGKAAATFPEAPPELEGKPSANTMPPPPLPQPEVTPPTVQAQPVTKPGVVGQAVNKFRGMVDPLFTENSKALAQMGPTGQSLANTVRDTYSAADVQAGQVYADLIKPLKALSQSEQANFKAVAEGAAQPVNNRVAQLSQIFNQARTDVANKADSLDLFQYGARQNYFPQVLDKTYLNNPQNSQTILDHLVSTQQAKSPEEAQNILDQLKNSVNGTSPASYAMNGGTITKQFGNIEQSRSDLQLPPEAYKQNPVDVLTNYFQKAYQRINEAQNFGVNGEKLPDYLNAIGAEGGNADRATQIMKQVLGSQDPGIIPKDINMGARNFESAFKLGTAWINHAGQITNPITTKGLWNTLHAVGQYVTSPDSAIDTALRSGSLNKQTLESATGDMYNNWVSKLPWLKTLGNVMTMNRIIDANASQFALKSMVDRLVDNPASSLARRVLQTQYGVNPEEVIANGGLHGEQFLQAINEGVNRDIAQFRPQDLPQVYSHPDFKLATQFKQFAFKQAQFIMDNVVKEAAHGNVTPLLRYLTAGTVLGEGVADAKYGVKNSLGAVTGAPLKPRPQGVGRVADNITSVGGGGLLNEAYQQLGQGGLNAYEWIFGPTVADGVKLGSNVVNAVKGKPAGLERQAIQQIPAVGGQAAQQYVPSAPRGRAPNPNNFNVNSYGTTMVPTVHRRK